MIVCFTLDDGLVNQIKFWNKTLIPSTYFVLPSSAEFKTYSKHTIEKLCSWPQVRLLKKHNEIGFHGFSTDYNKWSEQRVRLGVELQLEIFKHETGEYPKSFAYTDMRPGRTDIISKYFPYIRDYYWADGVNYRVAERDVPKEALTYRKKIYCMHPILEPVMMLRKLKEIAKEHEYCVIILHNIEEPHLLMAKIIAQVYETCTFREIFEGRTEKAVETVKPVPEKSTVVTKTGATPVVSPVKDEKVKP